ncbi:MAG: hypothetical protein HeimAB125_19850 [Candidatus Heimdallarchaeota archaeon AB_125]|nr:MAG: hypothetical protein HeimAB125_19850 [Candidatus Heimdallarchaeota archaeon AB_125]
MSNEFDEDQRKFISLQPKEKILFVRKQVDEIVSTLTQKNVDVDIFIERIAHFKTYTSRLIRLSGVYKKDYFDFLVYSIKTMWEAVERCTSQFMLYPALSAFIDLFSKLKGLNPYYTLDGAIEQTLEYGKLPSKDKIAELLKMEKQHLNFLIDYMQLDSILRLDLTKFEKKNIVKSATNYAQILVLTLYNFLVTVPVISKEDFLAWCKLFDDALEKARLGHHYLKEIDDEPFELLRTKISESSLFSLKAQLHLLSARFTNENVNEFLNLAYIDNSRALSEIEPYKNDELFSETIRSFYIQQKALLLETRFYQILHNIQLTQYKNSIYVGDLKDEKPELTKSLIKFEIEEILREIEGYVNDLLSRSKREELGISFNLISIYAKISLGAYIYDLVDDVSTMEEIIKTQRIDVGDPELSLLLARYWLIRWSEEDNDEYLQQSQNYFDRAAEVYQMLFNNRYVPIYGYSMVALYQLYRKNIPRAEIYLMKADDEYTDAKMLKILNSSEQYYYEKFREQIDLVIKGEKIERPLRFDKPLNPLDFNSWITEKKDWRKKLSSFPEPFPFHLDQLKILEFEFLSPENNNFQEKEDTL